MSFPSHEDYLKELIARRSRGEPVSLSGSSRRDAFTRWLATEIAGFLHWVTRDMSPRHVWVRQRWNPPDSSRELVWFDCANSALGRVFCANAWNLRDNVLLLRFSEGTDRIFRAEVGGDIVVEGDRFRIQRFAFGALPAQNVG